MAQQRDMIKSLASIISGLLFGYYTHFNIWPQMSFIKLIMFSTAALAVILFIKRKSLLLKNILVLVVIFGLSFCFGVGYVNVYNQKDVTEKYFEGQVVVKDISPGYESSKVVLYSKEMDKNMLLIIFAYQNITLIPGDILSVSGKLNSEVVIYPQREKDSWESFDYSNYLKTKGINYVLKANKYEKLVSHETNINRVTYRLRVYLLESLKKVMPDENAGVVMAMVLGDDRGLSKDIKDSFRDSGLSHVLVFSGFNFSVIIGAFSILLVSFSKKTRVISSLVFSVFIFFLAPLSAPTARAGAFVSYALLAEMFNKAYNVKFIFYLFILSYLLFDPLAASYNASFHLSVLAVMAIIYGGEMIVSFTNNAAKSYLLMIFAIFTVTAPYIAYMFGNVSLFSLFANAIALPIVSIITILGVVAMLVLAISETLGSIFAYVLNIFVNLLVGISNIFAPYAISLKESGVSLSFIVFYYLVLIIIYNFGIFSLKNKEN